MATRREEKRKMTAEVTRETLTQLIAQEMEMTASDSRVLLENILENMVNGIAQDGKLIVPNFGVFKTRQKPERPGRNSRTGNCHDQPPSYCFFQAIPSHQTERPSIKALMQKIININPGKI